MKAWSKIVFTCIQKGAQFFFSFWELNKEFLFIIIKKEISNKFLHYPLFVYLNCQSITKQETFMQKGQKRKGTVQRAMIGKS